jgi:hypothetical protein
MRRGNWCHVGDHELASDDRTVYRDIKNGITEDVYICHTHLLEHVEKFYGDCPISQAIRQRYEMEPYDVAVTEVC